jgi:cytochrome P450
VITFDPFDPDHLRHGVPFDLLARIRREEPICPTPSGARYLSRQADIQVALRDVESFRAELGPITGLGGLEDIPDDQLFLSEITEPRHGQIRRLYNSCFGPHRTRQVEGFVRQVCDELVDAMLDDGDVVDLHEGYALPIPGRVMAHIMGLPDRDAQHFLDWSTDGSIMTRPATPGVEAGGPPIAAYFRDQLAAERALAEPDNHVFDVLIGAEVDGAPLTDVQIVTQLHFMIMAGVHTTRGLLTHAVQRLLHSPDLYRRLGEDRSLVPIFVEESLRHDAPVQRTTRRCTRETEIGGITMHPGAWIEVGISSGNRDEDVYDDPESFRLDRPDPRNHLAFGGGSHVCPGATLARFEAVTAVETLLDRLAGLAEVPGAVYPPVPGNLGQQPIPAFLTPISAPG